VGQVANESKTVELEPSDHFGEYDPELLREIPLSQLPEGAKEGQVLLSPDGDASAKIVDIDGDMAIIDTNHPFAGKTLSYVITLLKVAPPL
jgi:FKBP-type peptidyl-prolyl cis-trans isomerase SlyD